MAEPDRQKMMMRLNNLNVTLESLYRQAWQDGYDAGQSDAESEHSVRYAVNVLDQLASVLRDEIKDRGASSYIADGLWIALREIDDLKDYVRAGGKCDDRK